MTRLQRFAAWSWDNIPGGVPAQLWVWRWCEPVATYCEWQADYRDLLKEET